MRIDSRYLEVPKMHLEKVKRVLCNSVTFADKKLHGGLVFRNQLQNPAHVLSISVGARARGVRTTLDRGCIMGVGRRVVTEALRALRFTFGSSQFETRSRRGAHARRLRKFRGRGTFEELALDAAPVIGCS